MATVAEYVICYMPTTASTKACTDPKRDCGPSHMMPGTMSSPHPSSDPLRTDRFAGVSKKVPGKGSTALVVLLMISCDRTSPTREAVGGRGRGLPFWLRSMNMSPSAIVEDKLARLAADLVIMEHDPCTTSHRPKLRPSISCSGTPPNLSS